MTIPMQNNVVYGPVNSRRLGSSLGINVLSTTKKLCNFNCVYCQYNWTKIKPADLKNNKNFISKVEILEKVEKALLTINPSPDYLTFSGNGEATLHPDFPDLVSEISTLRNEYTPHTKTAILSNSSTSSNIKIRNIFEKLDVRIMKLDCGSEDLFKLYNRPVVPVTMEAIVNGLSKMEDVTIQTLFTAGEHGNSNEADVNFWIEKLILIKPIDIQIYTLDRGYPSDKIYPVTLDWLNNLEIKLNNIDFKSKAYI